MPDALEPGGAVWHIVTLGAGFLGFIGLAAAVLLFVISRRFSVDEDPRISKIAEALPSINCGGCGLPGCRGFAEALVKASSSGSLSGFYCPPGGQEVMDQAAQVLGLSAEKWVPTVAVVRCNGSRAFAPDRVVYHGPPRCSLAHTLSAGASLCPVGCLRLGDCAASCHYGAMVMDAESGLPVVAVKKCISCGACVRSCPRGLIALIPRGRKDRRVWVSCRNREKPQIALKNCKAACIDCGKCAKACPVEAITMENNLAWIDPVLCIACGKCVSVCPTSAILTTLPPQKSDKEVPS